jgi:hypothetical protein
MNAQFSDDYRTVTDTRGTFLCLSPLQGMILRYLVELARPCSHTEVREMLQAGGYNTYSLRHAFYAAEGKRVWGALIKRAAGSRDHLILDLDFVAKPSRPRKPRSRDEVRPRKMRLDERLRKLRGGEQDSG